MKFNFFFYEIENNYFMHLCLPSENLPLLVELDIWMSGFAQPIRSILLVGTNIGLHG